MKKTAIIMAGGFGERFWPLSRMNRPKQILNLTRNDMNMIQESINRIFPIISYEDIFIITSEQLLEPIRKSVPEIPRENVIAEPAKRNTAPCLALGAAVILAKYPNYKPTEIVTAVLTADHKIEPNDKFLKNIQTALNFVYENKKIATIGIKPNRPETGFGYIELDKEIKDSIFKVKKFREKPDLQTAKKFFKSGNFLWNSGMFFWNIHTFIDELHKHNPVIGDKIHLLKDTYNGIVEWDNSSYNINAKDIFEEMPSISIDYALMEKTKSVVCLKSNFQWDDVGSWDSLDRVRKTDEFQNIIEGNVIAIDSNNCTIINDNSAKQIITGIGLTDLVIINTGDSIMICPKERSQDVKIIVNELRNRTHTELL